MLKEHQKHQIATFADARFELTTSPINKLNLYPFIYLIATPHETYTPAVRKLWWLTYKWATYVRCTPGIPAPLAAPRAGRAALGLMCLWKARSRQS